MAEFSDKLATIESELLEFAQERLRTLREDLARIERLEALNRLVSGPKDEELRLLRSEILRALEPLAELLDDSVLSESPPQSDPKPISAELLEPHAVVAAEPTALAADPVLDPSRVEEALPSETRQVETAIALDVSPAKLLERIEELEALKEVQDDHRFAVRSTICWARANMAVAQATHDYTGDPYGLLERLKTVNNRLPGNRAFWGLSMDRHLSACSWLELRDAYWAMRDVCVALRAMEIAPAEVKLEEVAPLCASVLFWLNDAAVTQHGLPTDQDQKELYGALRSRVGSRLYVDCWDQGWEPEEYTLRQRAAELAPVADGLRARLNGTIQAQAEKAKLVVQRKKAKEELIGWLQGDDLADEAEFIPELAHRVDQLLELGLPHSDKDLREALFPYRDLLEGQLRHAQGKRLIQALRQYGLQLLASAASQPRVQQPLDPQYLHKLEGVVALTRGKRMMIVGGESRPDHADRYRSDLELAEVKWDSSDNSDNANKFLPDIPKFDIVLYLIAYSRHDYARVYKKAKELGKLAVRVKAGYGLHRVVHDMYEQLVAPRGLASLR